MPSKFSCHSVARAILFSSRASNRQNHKNEQRHHRDKGAEGNERAWNLVSLVTCVLLGQIRINRSDIHLMHADGTMMTGDFLPLFAGRISSRGLKITLINNTGN